MARFKLKQSLLASGAAIGLLIAAPAYAQIREFNVPAQDARQAIPQFARQAGVQISAPTGRLRGVRTRAIRGNLDAREALRALIEGTGLSIASDNGSMIVLRYGTEVEQGSPSSGEVRAGDAAADSESATLDHAGIAEILVIGTRSQNVDIRRTENDPQPYVVFRQEELQRSGASNLEDFMRRRLPMNTSPLTLTQSAGSSADNRSEINLRGLGASQTLILIDGRPAPRIQSQSTAPSQGDINGISLAAIERIEILPATAGGIYGGSAVGGVINIIRRRDYNGISVHLGYDGTFRGGGESRRLEVVGGFGLNNGDTRITFSASDIKTEALYAGDNNLWRRGRERYVANGGAAAPGAGFAGYTANIYSSNGTNLVLDNGTVLSAAYTFVPIGYAGTQTDGGAALVTNIGKLNTELALDESGALSTLRNGSLLRSANFNVRQSLAGFLDVFGDIDWNRAETGNTFSPRPALTIPGDAPSNPFRQSILVWSPIIAGLDYDLDNIRENFAATAGAIIRITDNWSSSIDYRWAQTRGITHFFGSAGLPNTFFADVAGGTLNVLRDVNAFPIDFTRYDLSAEPNAIAGPFATAIERLSVRTSGSGWRLPGGRIGLSTQLEHRVEIARATRNTLPGFFGSSTSVFPTRSQTINSAYAEVRVPIFGSLNSLPFAHLLDVQASVRHDRYNTNVPTPNSYQLTTGAPPALVYSRLRFQSTDYTLAARWAPTPDLTLRGSYSTGFLAPSVRQLVQQPSPGFPSTTLRDPRRGNEIIGSAAPFILVFGGSPNLQPEQSSSLSFGAILTPTFLPGFRASIDYISIDKNEEIGTFPTTQYIVDNESLFPERIQRQQVTNGAGPIILIDNSAVNIARSKVRAWDAQVDYSRDLGRLGRFTIYSVVTYQPHLRVELTPTAVPFELSGYTTLLPIRGNIGVDWMSGPWTFGWNAQYFDDYSLRLGNDPNGPLSNQRVALQGAERVPSQVYHDISVGYRFSSRGFLAGLEVLVGVQNVFDQRPPIVAGVLSGYSSYGDARLRRYSLRLTKRFE